MTRRQWLHLTAAGVALAAVARAPFAAEPGLKIGTIGSGRIGATLGEIWLKAGHEVMFSSLDLEHDRALAAKLGGRARAGTSKEAVAFGDVILLAVPYGAMPAVAKDLGAAIRGKAVIDASNPIAARDGEVGAKARERGAGLATADYLPGARIVRAFNAVGYSRLPEIAAAKGERPGMPIAGDDKSALAVASRLIRDAGFEPVVVGGLAMGKHLVPGTPLGGVQTPGDLRKAAAGLN